MNEFITMRREIVTNESLLHFQECGKVSWTDSDDDVPLRKLAESGTHSEEVK